MASETTWLSALKAQRIYVGGTEVLPAVRHWEFINASVAYNATTKRVEIDAGVDTLADGIKTADYTAAISETVLVDPTSGPVQIDLPTAVGNAGRRVIVKNFSASTNTITLEPNGSETIDGAANDTITATWGAITIESDGSNWFRVSEIDTTGGPITGSGTSGNLARFTGASSIGDTGVTEDGSGNLGAATLALGGNGATGAALSLASADAITFETNAGDSAITGLTSDSTDRLIVGGTNASAVQLRVGANPVFEADVTKLQAHLPIELQPGIGNPAQSGHLRAKKDTTILAVRDAAGTGDHALLTTDPADGFIIGASSLAHITAANDVLRVGGASSNYPTTGTVRHLSGASAYVRDSGNSKDIRIWSHDAGSDDLTFGDAITVLPAECRINTRVEPNWDNSNAASGAIGLRNTAASGGIYYRDGAGSTDVLGMALDASDNLLLGDSNVTLTNVASSLAVGSAAGTVATTGTIRLPENAIVSADSASGDVVAFQTSGTTLVVGGTGPLGGLQLRGATSIAGYIGSNQRFNISDTLINNRIPVVVDSDSGTVSTTGSLRGANGFSVYARTLGGSNAKLLELDGSDNLVAGDYTNVTTANLRAASTVNLGVGGAVQAALNTFRLELLVPELRFDDGETSASISHDTTSSATAADMSMTAQSSEATSGTVVAGDLNFSAGSADGTGSVGTRKGGDINIVAGSVGGSLITKTAGVVTIQGGADNGGEGAHGGVVIKSGGGSTVIVVSGGGGLGLHGASATSQHASMGETSGFTANSNGSVFNDSTFTGNVGTKAYTISDVVKALKNKGLMAA